MSRVIHFGVIATDALRYAQPLAQRVTDALEGTVFTTDGDSFTEWGETHAGVTDAVHVQHLTESDHTDPEGEVIRLSPDEVREVAEELDEHLRDTDAGLRVVDQWVEGDGDVWSEDNYLHGPFALQSISGRRV